MTSPGGRIAYRRIRDWDLESVTDALARRQRSGRGVCHAWRLSEKFWYEAVKPQRHRHERAARPTILKTGKADKPSRPLLRRILARHRSSPHLRGVLARRVFRSVSRNSDDGRTGRTDSGERCRGPVRKLDVTGSEIRHALPGPDDGPLPSCAAVKADRSSGVHEAHANEAGNRRLAS
jgi:hypothetical protein